MVGKTFAPGVESKRIQKYGADHKNDMTKRLNV